MKNVNDQSAAQAGRISLRGPMQRLILRSQSSRTASDNALTFVGPVNCDNNAEQSCHRAKGRKRPLPLSRDSSHSSKQTRHQRLGHTPLRPTASASVKNSASSAVQRGSLNREKIISPPGQADRSCASLLLSQARRSIELDTAWLGRRRYIMDVILDLKAQVPENPTKPDALLSPMHMEDQNLCLAYRVHNFADQCELALYWANQAAILAGMCILDHGDTGARFPYSIERSTATWSPALNNSGHHIKSGQDGVSLHSPTISGQALRKAA